jgi:hypothetical protein
MTANQHNTQEELASYAMQNLPVEESASIRAHLQSCATCRDELAQVCGDLALLGLGIGSDSLVGLLLLPRSRRGRSWPR